MSDKRPDFARAADFMWRHARLLDRLRFAYFFLDGDRAPVLAALRAYQNADGGLGHALEPDLRSPASQPGAIRTALELVDQIDGFADPMVERVCDYLPAITTPEGGLPFALPSAAAYPHPPWWQPKADPPAAVTFTAPIAGLLHKHQVAHPWIERATAYCWKAVDVFDVAAAQAPRWDINRIGKSYAAQALLIFLEHAPDRVRAQAAFARIGQLVLDRKLVELDPDAAGEVHKPLDYAPSPDRHTHALFADENLAAHLDVLVAGQQPDGGWMFNWQAWNPAATWEWRGYLTVERLLTLRAYGRL